VLTIWRRVLLPHQAAHLNITAFPANADVLRIAEVLARAAGQDYSCAVMQQGARKFLGLGFKIEIKLKLQYTTVNHNHDAPPVKNLDCSRCVRLGPVPCRRQEPSLACSVLWQRHSRSMCARLPCGTTC
jgi:hypothetical protein